MESSVVAPVTSAHLQCVLPWWYFPATSSMALSLVRDTSAAIEEGGHVVIVAHDSDLFEVEPSWSSMGRAQGDAHGGDAVVTRTARLSRPCDRCAGAQRVS